VATLLGCGVAYAQVPVPPLTAHVIDQTGTLSAADRAALNDKLTRFERERGSQVVVLVLHTTQPEDITAYTQRLGDAWKLGRPGVGDGVLLVVAKDDRRMRIATAKAVEGALPDLLASRIIDQVIAPRFRANDYAGGLDAGLDQVLAHLRGESLPLPAPEAPDGWTDLWVFALFAAPILSAVCRQLFGKRLGSLVSGVAMGGMAWHLTALWWVALVAGLLGVLVGLVLSLLPTRVVQGHTGLGSHHGGGTGAGGFSAGGGGDFGGGGASGSW
jgi:uncharacterized protein